MPKKTLKTKKRVNPVKSTAQKQKDEENKVDDVSKIKDSGLRLSWVRFIDALIANGGDQPAAYMAAYPDVKDAKVASAAATRLLKNVNVREELNNKLTSQKATEDYIVDRLMGLVELHFVGKGAIVAVKSLEILAKMKGLLVDTKRVAFTGDNPAVFPSLYTDEEKKKMASELMGENSTRIVE